MCICPYPRDLLLIHLSRSPTKCVPYVPFIFPVPPWTGTVFEGSQGTYGQPAVLTFGGWLVSWKSACLIGMKPWFLPTALCATPTFGRRKQKDQVFKTVFGYTASEISLGYMRPCVKQTTKTLGCELHIPSLPTRLKSSSGTC